MQQAPSLIDFKELLEQLKETDQPLWGTMNAAQMCRHCTSFIKLSVGEKQTSRTTRVIGWLFGKYMYRYFSQKNPWNLPRNLQTLPEIKQRPERVLDFELEKEQLAATIQKAMNVVGTVRHPLYGLLNVTALHHLIATHTAYHFRQFGLLA